MKRVFIGVKIIAGPVLLKTINSLKTVLAGEKIKWVDPENIHLTLAFIGETEEERIKILSIMLKQACTGLGNSASGFAQLGFLKTYAIPGVMDRNRRMKTFRA